MRLVHRIAVCAVSCLAAAASIVSVYAAPPDVDFYTSYSFFNDYQAVLYSVCGATPTNESCYGGGQLGPFKRIGCMIEGDATTVGNVVTRGIYVVDVASGKTGTGVTLYRYLKTDTIYSTGILDSVDVKLTYTIPLPPTLVGGANASCTIAGTSSFLYIGTDQNSLVLRVKKGPLSVYPLIGGSTQFKIKSITSNPYGFVAITFLSLSDNVDSFSLYGPDGRGLEMGGGPATLLTSFAGTSNTGP